jgi:hypothetical protein
MRCLHPSLIGKERLVAEEQGTDSAFFISCMELLL